MAIRSRSRFFRPLDSAPLRTNCFSLAPIFFTRWPDSTQHAVGVNLESADNRRKCPDRHLHHFSSISRPYALNFNHRWLLMPFSYRLLGTGPLEHPEVETQGDGGIDRGDLEDAATVPVLGLMDSCRAVNGHRKR